MSRRLGPETIGQLALCAGLPLAAQNVEPHVERLREFLDLLDEWDELGLAFRFEQGEFTYVPVPAQFRPEWQLPTPLNGRRPVDGPDSGGAAGASGAAR